MENISEPQAHICITHAKRPGKPELTERKGFNGYSIRLQFPCEMC